MPEPKGFSNDNRDIQAPGCSSHEPHASWHNPKSPWSSSLPPAYTSAHQPRAPVSGPSFHPFCYARFICRRQHYYRKISDVSRVRVSPDFSLCYAQWGWVYPGLAFSTGLLEGRRGYCGVLGWASPLPIRRDEAQNHSGYVLLQSLYHSASAYPTSCTPAFPGRV